MRDAQVNENAGTLALRALAWTLAEPERARRLLDVTGLDPADLRTRASDPAVLGATIAFLAANEADLVALADALDVPPAALAQAGEALA